MNLQFQTLTVEVLHIKHRVFFKRKKSLTCFLIKYCKRNHLKINQSTRTSEPTVSKEPKRTELNIADIRTEPNIVITAKHLKLILLEEHEPNSNREDFPISNRGLWAVRRPQWTEEPHSAVREKR